MCPFVKEDIVVKRVIAQGLVCDRPCWLLWIKAYNSFGALCLTLRIYNNRSAKGDITVEITAGKKQSGFAPLKVPVRFSRGIYTVFTSALMDVEFGFVPD